MRVFLSLGFSGRSEEEVMNEIKNAMAAIIKRYSYIAIEFVHNFNYTSNSRVECLGEAIKQMSTCDHVYFINNWNKHKGCMVEKLVCKLYNIPFTNIKLKGN